jgi:hypothetical protein
MRRNDRNPSDVSEITDRLAIDLFKNKIQETQLDPNRLEGTWVEACSILRDHFGKLSRIMIQNEYKLHSLYRAAIKELKQA